MSYLSNTANVYLSRMPDVPVQIDVHIQQPSSSSSRTDRLMTNAFTFHSHSLAVQVSDWLQARNIYRVQSQG